MLYGRNLTLRRDTLLLTTTPRPSEFARDAIARVDHARQIACSRLLAAQATQKAFYDSKHFDVDFSPGSLVLVWCPYRRVGLSKKLLSQYKGPYRIIRRVTYVTYEVIPVSGTNLSANTPSDVVHVSRLKPYRPSSEEHV